MPRWVPYPRKKRCLAVSKKLHGVAQDVASKAKKRRRAPHLIDRAEVSLRSEPNGLRDAVALQEMSVGTSEQDGKRVAEAISFRACPCRRPVAAECVRCKAPLCLESCGTRSGEHLFPFCEGCEVEAFYQEDAQPPPPEWLPPGWQVGRSITCKPDRFGRPRKAFKCMCSRIFLNPSDIQYHIPRCALSQTALMSTAHAVPLKY